MITGGGWTLEQSGAAVGLKSVGYCDSNGNQIGNPGTERMQPYYFPTIVGQGKNLQGYFDYRPKDIDEAVAAAVSHDGGHTWILRRSSVCTECGPCELQRCDGDLRRIPHAKAEERTG
jgi:hypothetical protein